jgi:hypothetical protein
VWINLVVLLLLLLLLLSVLQRVPHEWPLQSPLV